MDSLCKKVTRYSVYSLGVCLLIGIYTGLLYVLPRELESQGVIECWWHLPLLVLGALLGIALLGVLIAKAYAWAWNR